MAWRKPKVVEDPTPAAARTAALLLLGRRELSSRQLRDRLHRRGFPDGIIDQAFADLQSTGALDDSLLFYLRARGIPENEARCLLIKAFVAEIVEELESEPLVEALEAILEKWLAEHV